MSPNSQTHYNKILLILLFLVNYDNEDQSDNNMKRNAIQGGHSNSQELGKSKVHLKAVK